MREDIKEILFTQEDLKAITKELGEKVTRITRIRNCILSQF